MKKQLLSLLLLASSYGFAQVAPSDVNTPSAFYTLYDDFPNIRSNYTEMKMWKPSIAGTGETVWYSFAPGYNTTSKVINAVAFNNIDPSNSISDETRIQNVIQTGNSYEFTIELNDGGTWTPYERNTVYFDANGKDTAWTVAEHNGTFYELTYKITKTFNASGKLTASYYYGYDAGDWKEFLRRAITYNGNQRTSDKFDSDAAGPRVDVGKYDYIYTNNKLDSMVYSENGQSGFTPTNTYKMTLGTDGAINQIKAYEIPDGKTEFELAYRAVFTGGNAVGLKEVNTNEVAVYPNPASNQLTIQVKDAGTYSANIVDLQGKTVLNTNITKEESAVNISALNNGLYFLVLTDATGNSTQKRLVIAK